MDSIADEHPHNGRRIWNKQKFRRKVGRGCHIAERRSLGYYHHYIVEYIWDTGIQLIYYGLRCNEIVRVHDKYLPFDEINFKLGIYLIKSEGYPESREGREEAIRRAHSRLQEDNYSLAFNNCEHFVTWALTGRSVNYQIKDAKPWTKFGIYSFDACVNKDTACKLGVDSVTERVDGNCCTCRRNDN